MSAKKPGRGQRSVQWFGRQDIYGFIYRSWVKNRGVPHDHFDGRPVIGICNTYSELTPCNSHFRTIAEHVKNGVLEAGGFPLEFPVAEEGCRAMQGALEPGITENALWAKLHETNIRLGGEWIETRLLSSGPRTNPWFRECSMRVIERGDMVSFDTDLIGPYGYCADISRSWICGAKPTGEQRTLYATAVEQLEHNIGILRPGLTYREVAERSWPIPERYRSQRYSCLLHGVGLADEYPSIPYGSDFDTIGYDGVLEPGMTLCVESFIGVEGGREGVKLEEQVLVTDTGIERLSTYPFEISMSG